VQNTFHLTLTGIKDTKSFENIFFGTNSEPP